MSPDPGTVRTPWPGLVALAGIVALVMGLVPAAGAHTATPPGDDTAGGEQPELTHLADDFVVAREGDRAGRPGTRAIDGEGYNLYDPLIGNVGSYEITLIDSPGIEELRANVEDAADELAAVTEETFEVAAGTAPLSELADPMRGEINIIASDDWPCTAAGITACGFSYWDTAYPGSSLSTTGKAWFSEPVIDDDERDQTALVSHELGHTLGLDHFNGRYQGQRQTMNDSGLVSVDYRAGDRNGLRFLADGGATYLAKVIPFRGFNAFLGQQSRDFLDRAPSLDERRLYAAALAYGKISGDRVVANYALADGSIGPVGSITRLYAAYFGRAPDSGGLSYWVSALRGGRPLGSISQVFAASDEFEARYGSLTDAEFVRRVYRNVLGRAGDAEGLDFWTSELTSGRRNRGEVMIGFSESAEFGATTRAEARVVTVYSGMLDRAPTAEEHVADSAALEDGSLALTGLVSRIRTGRPYADRVR